MTCIAALDVGGSSIKGGVVSGLPSQRPGVRDRMQVTIDSGAPADELLARLTEVIETLTEAAGGIGQVVIGFPGPFDYAAGVCRIRDLAKFEALYGLNLKRLLQERLAKPVDMRFRNDAEAFALGEARFGAGQPFGRMLCLTLGTGLGSCFIEGGRRVTEGHGVPPGGELNEERLDGRSSDDLFSTRGLQARLEDAGLPANVILAAKLAEQGDLRAVAAFEEFDGALGRLVRPFCRRFRAEAVVVGGGIAHAWRLFGPALADALRVETRRSALSKEAALLGAALLFQEAD